MSVSTIMPIDDVCSADLLRTDAEDGEKIDHHFDLTDTQWAFLPSLQYYPLDR